MKINLPKDLEEALKELKEDDESMEEMVENILWEYIDGLDPEEEEEEDDEKGGGED